MKNLNLAVVELHEKGLSYNQIAKELGISKSKAYRIINETQNVSENETKAERSISKVFQNVPKQPEITKDNKKYNAESLKLQVKLRKLELEHEAKMKLFDFEENAKQRKFELKNKKINSKIELLKQKNEELKERISKLNQINIEEYNEIEDDEYIPEIDILIKDNICNLFSEIIEKDKFYLDDIKTLFVTTSQIKADILDWIEKELIENNDILEFDLLNKVENVISDYKENFEDYLKSWRSTINMEFEEDLFSEMEDYIIQNSDK